MCGCASPDGQVLKSSITELMSRAKEEEKGARYAQKEDEIWKIKDIVEELIESTSRHFRFCRVGAMTRSSSELAKTGFPTV